MFFSIFIGLFAIALLVGFFLLENSKKSAEKSIQDQSGHVVNATTNIRSKFADNTISIDDKANSVADYIGTLNSSIDDMCNKQLGLIYFVYSSQYQKCKDSIDALRIFRDTTVQLSEFLKEDMLLSATIPSVSSNLTYQQSYELWSNSLVALEAVSVNDRLDTTKTALKSAITAHRDDWKALIDADAIRDKDAFNGAKDAISSSYTTLIQVSDIQTKSLIELQEKFNSDYQSFLTQTN